MFSTGEYQYIKDLSLNLYSKGYTYYFCVTNNPIDYNTNNVPDVYCYYSKNEITNNGYIFSIPSNTLKCNFDSNSYSNNNTIDKLSCSNVASGNITASSKEFIYSNVGNYSNIIQDYESNYDFYSKSYLVILSILAVIIFIFLYKFVSSLLRLR